MTQIGKRMGLSRSYASDLLRDPDGSLSRQRKDNYSLPCPRCGNPMSGSNGLSGAPRLCIACAILEQTEERYWTADRVLEALKEYKAKTGRQPTAIDIQISGGGGASVRARLSDERIAESEQNHGLVKLPRLGTIYREFGSFTNALLAAGMQPNPGGGKAHRDPKERAMPEFVVFKKKLNDWSPIGTISAPNPNAAIEDAADNEGTYVAIRKHYWTEQRVESRQRFAVVPPLDEAGE